ncbi:MAG: TIGR03435 family protein, partial [Terriglobia bacterium]
MKTRITLTIALGLILAAVAALGQTPNTGFEVATVKPSPLLDRAKMAAEIQAGRMPRFGPHVSLSQAEYNFMLLRDLIALAYNVKAYQITGPPWLATERFDIVAKMPDGASKDDAPKFLQALLAERFKLAVHRDTQERPVLALVVGKDGPKLKESPAPPAPIDENAPLKPGEMKMDSPEGPARITRNPDNSMTINRGAKGIMKTRFDAETRSMIMESSNVTMPGLAEQLTGMFQMGGSGGKQVVDQTGLKGSYEVTMEFAMADLMAMARSQGMMPMGPG